MARSYADVYADITAATVALCDTADLTGAARLRARAEQYKRLALLWGEVSKMSDRDRLPSTSYLSARLLADRYANDANDARAELARGQPVAGR